MRALFLALALTSQLVAQQSDTGRARAIVMRHLDAIGGVAAYNAVQSVHMVMALQLPQDIELRQEVWTTKPNFFYTSVRSSIGFMEGGFDGKTYWHVDTDGKVTLERYPSSGVYAVFDPYAVLERFGGRYTGVQELAGKRLEAVESIAEGQVYTQYFDARTGLLARIEIGNPASPTTTVMFDRYKKLGKMMYATSMRTRFADGGEGVARILSVDHSPIDPKRYEAPQAIRDLAARKP